MATLTSAETGRERSAAHEPNGRPTPDDAMRRLLEGTSRFRADIFDRDRALFAALARGQSPHTLMIGCADSRVSPELITQTRPGELFVLRNVGNIVPPFVADRNGNAPAGDGEAGCVSAAIEYAVAALGVSHIVVCGHTDCGAMKALAAPDGGAPDRLPAVRAWLRHAAGARDAVGAPLPGGGHDSHAGRLGEENVLLQLAHLRTHPAVASALARGTLALHGWIYDVGHGVVSVIDPVTRRPIAVAEALRRLDAPA